MTHEEKMELIAASQVLATLAVAYSNMVRYDDLQHTYETRSRMASDKAVRCLDDAQVYSLEALKR